MLMMFGAMAVYSSIAFFAQMHGTTAGRLVTGHIVKLGIAFIAMMIVSKLNYRVLARFSRIAVIFSWLLLIAVMIYGDLVFGARRSLSIGGFSFQPSSFAAIALIIHVAVMLHEKQEYIKDFKRAFLPIMIWVGITCFLIALEDFSSAALLMGICVFLMFVGRISALQIFGLILIGIVGRIALVMSSAERHQPGYKLHHPDQRDQHRSPGVGQRIPGAAGSHRCSQRRTVWRGHREESQRDFLPAPYNDFILPSSQKSTAFSAHLHSYSFLR
jgi:cell division protein FtsW